VGEDVGEGASEEEKADEMGGMRTSGLWTTEGERDDDGMGENAGSEGCREVGDVEVKTSRGTGDVEADE